jgi:hypothetical protein
VELVCGVVNELEEIVESSLKVFAMIGTNDLGKDKC